MTRTAVVITDRQLLPAHRGNRIRILGMLRGLRGSGWRVELICLPDAGSDEELRSEVDRVGRVRARPYAGGDVRSFDCRPFRWAVERAVTTHRSDVVIAEYAWMAPALRRLPRSIRRVVDCHDVLHERTDRFTGAGLDPWVRCTAAQEETLLRGADLLLTTQHRDTDTLRALVPGVDVACVLPEVAPTAQPCAAPGRSRVLAVGASHAGNDGILHFAVTGWPTVIAAVDQARLDIAGSVVPAAAGRGVAFLGEVDDLPALYRGADVVICPVDVGTGVKIKMIEALRFGKAVVATPTAAEGLPMPDPPAWIEVADGDECAAAVAGLLRRPDERARLERAAAEYARRHLAPETIRSTLHSALTAGRLSRRWLPQPRRRPAVVR